MGNGLHILFMLAIISTAISLTTIFTDYLREDVFEGKVSHMHALLITLALSGCSANGGLYAILRFEKPFLELFYPPLIVLTLCNIAYKLWNFRPVKTPVALAFSASTANYFFL
jgi:LIVCS family branched-chain amino acid:cation transporter